MAITYEQAVAKLHEWTENPALRNHARAVEAAMRRAAHRYGAGAARRAAVGDHRTPARRRLRPLAGGAPPVDRRLAS